MTAEERERALQDMDEEISRYCGTAVRVCNHPFIEFAGAMTAHSKSCLRAHQQGIDFTNCNRRAGTALPMRAVDVDYLVDTLDCIFGGRTTAVSTETAAPIFAGWQASP